MTYPVSKAEYNAARMRALRRMARDDPAKYEHYMEEELGRPLKESGRKLTDRVRRGEKPWGENR